MMLSILIRNKLFVVLAVFILACVAYLIHPSEVFWIKLPIEPEKIKLGSGGGNGYEIDLGFESFSGSEHSDSTAVLIEDGVSLGPPNALLDRISGNGLGRYAFQNGVLYFSTSDNSDPRANDRNYKLALPLRLRYIWHILFGALGAYLLFIAPWRILLPVGNAGWGTIPKKLRWSVSIYALGLLSLAFVDVLPVITANLVAETGIYSRTVDMREFPVIAIENGGIQYYAFDISSLNIGSLAGRPGISEPSPVMLMENGAPLTPLILSGDLKETMSAAESGTFLHAQYMPVDFDDSYYNPLNKQDLLFFIPDQGAPKDNNYTLVIPATAADAYRFQFSDSSRKHLWIFILLVSVICSWWIKKSIGALSPNLYQFPLILALGIAYFLITVFGIIRTQPCLPQGAYSYWDVFCVSPDSGSYYKGYTPASPRGPGYPLFIQAVAGDWDNLVKMTDAQPLPMGVWIVDESHPLLKVSRAQIALLLLSGLTLCLVMMRRLNSPLVPVFFLFFFDFHLYIFHELNQILTETLTQTWLILIVACFIAFIWKQEKWILPVTAILVGFSYITRQASVYAAGIFFAMLLWAFITAWKAYWKISLLSFSMLVALIFSPDFYALLVNGKSAQENLTYQYRAVYALRVAEYEDLQFMPDAESRDWLAESLWRRDEKDAGFDEMCNYEPYCMWVYRIESTYEVAITQAIVLREPAFYIKVSDAIMARHMVDYLLLGFDGWFKAITSPQVDRIQGIQSFFGIPPLKPFYMYGAALILILRLRGKTGYVSAMLILAHWAHVYISCLFSAPIQRIIWASDGLIFIAFFLLALEVSRRAMPYLVSTYTGWQTRRFYLEKEGQ